MTEPVTLSNFELASAASLLCLNALISLALRLQLGGLLILAGVRTVAQLLLAGWLLQSVVRSRHIGLIVGVMLAMTCIAGTAASRRVASRYSGVWLDSLLAVLVTAWLTTALSLTLVIRPRIWWDLPGQYAIPLIGMILGNTLNGISLAADRLTSNLQTSRREIELRLTLGATRWQAAGVAIRDAVRTGMIPMINSMMVVGIVSLPGMMTGQMLAGVPPTSAVRYQIAIMFIIAAGTALGTVSVTLLAYRRFFDSSHQFLWWKLPPLR